MKESSDNSPRCEVCGHINCHHTPLDQAIAKVEAKAAMNPEERDAAAIKTMEDYGRATGQNSCNLFDPVFSGYCCGYDEEHARLSPLVTQLLSIVREQGEALAFYSAMRFNREKMEWMPGGPDKAVNAQARTLEALKTLGGE